MQVRENPSASLEVLSFPHLGFIKEAGGSGISDSVAKVAGTSDGNCICADDGGCGGGKEAAAAADWCW